ncbi:DNA-directed RNA polymerase, mitochondrial-like [Daphnia pulex]|uniref:DNA-directed RNA polymerase, mitochondrial-like n=1 Tax=Daphnia pulex TaxID=6669 RepID=UPI001EDF304C|nr:DNA-directed RNA polymerase, mitochondrial-like [Daphnia pulex]
MISCRKCLATLASYHLKGFQLSRTMIAIRVNCIKTTCETRNSPGHRNFSISNPNSRASIKSQDQNSDPQKIGDEEIELHEEETEESHNTYLLPNFLTEPSEGTEVLLDGVPKIVSEEKILKTNREIKSAKAQAKKAEKKLRDHLQSEDAKATAIELQKKKEIAFRLSLKSYVTMCMQQGMVYKAMLLLRNYHGEVKHFKSSEVYDAMLREASACCSWKLIKEIVTMMEEGGIPFTLESFAACFIGLGLKSERESGLEAISENLLDKMEICDLNVDDIFKTCKFLGNHRELAIKGIRLGLPDFEPEFSSTPLTYTTPLLTSLNDTHVESAIPSNVEGLLKEDNLKKLATQQLDSEMSGAVFIQSITNSNSISVDNQAISEMEKLEQEWIPVLREAIIRDMQMCKAQFEATRRKTLHIYPFLSALSTEDYVRLLTQEVQMLSGTSELFSPSMHLFCRNLGFKVIRETRIQRKKENGQLEKFQLLYEKYCQWYMNPTKDGQLCNPRQMWQQLVTQHQMEGCDLDYESIFWPHTVVLAVGQFLYNIILSNLKISDPTNTDGKPSPAFYVVYRTKGVRSLREIKPHPQLVKFYDEIRKKKLSFDSSLLPMLSPPLPWSSHKCGGYLVTDVSLVRLPAHASKQRSRLANTPPQQLYPALDALNALGSIPWRINGAILDLVIQIFNANGSKELHIPQPPSALAIPSPVAAEADGSHKVKAYRDRIAFKRQKAEMYSLWCDSLYRLSLANHFRDKVFWLPHNMDFRGRVYPCSPHLTHLSHDMARSLLFFAQGKPLGADGFNWLKLHVINLTGTKKREPISERYAYAEKIMPEILDSADNPLTGRQWWVNSDEPWQTLAACMEVANALRCPEGPEAYVCHLPIHQDGSCNGLQHYAALGRDTVGAESVNLTPADRPQDVYSNVANLVERERSKDAANNVEIAQLLAGLINRKIIKQTVMTTVYGVTRYGARLQIAKQLKELPSLTPEQVQVGSVYLADKTFQSLQDMFTSAKDIQDWFTESAKLISTVAGESVEWITPIGLPVVQSYNNNPYDEASRPNAIKQRNAFPPNFIHSLDSSHMMLTALYCQRKGITFASIHDCFWTHPCTVAEMNKICRQQFVSLHSQPILEDLSKFLVSQFAVRASGADAVDDDTPKGLARHRLNQIISEVPRRGMFDLRLVLDSVYFFS